MEKEVKINLGSGNEQIIGYTNLDLRPLPNVDIVADLAQSWPFSPSSLAAVRGFDVIEHVADKLHFLREMWRVLKPNGIAVLQIPDAEIGSHAFRDPDHKSFWVKETFRPIYLEPCPS